MLQLASASSSKETIDEVGLNFMIAVIRELQPRDHIEAMLAAQMAAVHVGTMTFARRLNYTDTIRQQDSADNAFNKLARTFAAQVEALRRYRTGGEQKVRVEHVTVNAGGQAIVGNVAGPGGGSPQKSEDQSHEPKRRSLTYEPSAPLPSAIETDREPVRSAGNQGQEGLPLPRREGARRAEGQPKRSQARPL
jgi:hypothetical protein